MGDEIREVGLWALDRSSDFFKYRAIQGRLTKGVITDLSYMNCLVAVLRLYLALHMDCLKNFMLTNLQNNCTKYSNIILQRETEATN